jgi:hypothetical protein
LVRSIDPLRLSNLFLIFSGSMAIRYQAPSVCL